MTVFAPSAKGLQLLAICYKYGCKHDVQYNAMKSVTMYIDSRRAGYAKCRRLADTTLTIVNKYKYLGHVISNDLSDDADI